MGKLISPWAVRKWLDNKFIGQHEAKRALGTVTVMAAAGVKNVPNLMISGPSGTGKTSMSKHATAVAKVHGIVVPLTTYTQTGYVGDSVDEIIKDLVHSLNHSMAKVYQRFRDVGKKTVDVEYGDIETDFLTYTDNTAETVLESVKRNLRLIKKYMYSKAFKLKFSKKNAREVPAALAVPDEFVKEHSKLLGFDAKAMRFKNNRGWIDSAVEYIRTALDEPDAWRVRKYGPSYHPTLLVRTYATCYRGSKLAPQHELEAYVLAYSMSLKELALDTFENRYYETLEYKANHSVVILDEFDKIASNGDRDNVGRSGLQRDLLVLLGGSNYRVSLNEGESKTNEAATTAKSDETDNNTLAAYLVRFEKPKVRTILVDTHGICFIGAGAFESENLDGIISELIGRFGIITRTESLTLEHIVNIIPQVLREINDEYREIDAYFELTNEAVHEMAAHILKANKTVNTGARRVKSLLTSVILPKVAGMYYFPTSGKQIAFTVDVDDVNAALTEWKRTQMFQEATIGFN